MEWRPQPCVTTLGALAAKPASPTIPLFLSSDCSHARAHGAPVIFPLGAPLCNLTIIPDMALSLRKSGDLMLRIFGFLSGVVYVEDPDQGTVAQSLPRKKIPTSF